MNINGVDVKLNVLILSLEHEIDVTVQTIECLLIDIEDNVIISVLLNGGSDSHLRDMLSKFSFVRYHKSPNNLGVAGGRIFLGSTEEFKTADVICILDNDVVVPRDYLRKMATRLLADERMGAVGAVVLDIKNYYPKLDRFRKPSGGITDEIYDLTCDDAKSLFLAAPSPKGLYHIGTHRNWFMTYLTPLPLTHTLLNRMFEKVGISRRMSNILKDDTRYLRKIVQGEDQIEVSNIAGCSLSFRRDLVDEIGKFDSRFNPYGLEDVDFNVRAMKAGYKNYTFCDVWLLHGTDSRHKQRPPEKRLRTSIGR